MELDGAQYLGFSLPFSISQLVWIEAILVGGAEIYRNRELEPQARIYPGECAAHTLGFGSMLCIPGFYCSTESVIAAVGIK